MSRLLRAYNSVDDFRFSYDSRNRLSGVGIYTSSLNTILTTTISENQNTTIINSYFGITKTLIYNSYNQLISINYNPPNNNSENVSLTYDSDKRLSSITDTCGYSNETISYSYNNYGQLFSVNRSSYANLTISYIYNDFGEVQSRQELNSGSSNSEILKYKIVSSFIRDANTRDLLSSSIVISEKSTLGTYIPVFTLLNAKTFDDLYRLNSITTKIGTYGVGFSLIEYKDGTNNTTSHQIKKITYQNNGDVSYTYDGNGNIKTISDSFVDNSTKQYSYDSRGQLITEKDLMEETTTTYSYDYNGNITSIVKKQTYYPKATLESHSFTYSKTVLNLLVAYDNQAISYDNNYNPTSLNGATLTYYRGNKLYSYFKSGVSTQYRYNGFGIRTYKQVASTTHHYILDNERILKEVLVTSASTKVINYIYDLSGVAGFVYNDNLYLYQKNLLDDIIAIYQVTSSSSTLVAKYKYDPYGNHQVFNPDGTLNTTPSFIGHINPFRYRSYYFDEESGFYYCQTRYYVPYLRRWLTMDDLSYLDNTSSNGLNLFMYCHNNPIMYKDETGQLPIIISMALIGIAVGAASYAFSECISAAITGEWSWSWGQFGGSIFGGAIGGIFSALGAGICLTGFVTGFFSTATGMLLQNGFGEANYSFNSIMTFSIFTGVLSALAAKATDYIRIPRINAGKNSFGAITKSIITKQNGSISSISIKTASKSLIYVMYGSLLSTIMSGIMDAQAQSNESDEFYFLINNSFY